MTVGGKEEKERKSPKRKGLLLGHDVDGILMKSADRGGSIASVDEVVKKLREASKDKVQSSMKEQQEAQAWNETFKNASHRRDPRVLEGFWSEVKTRLLSRFGSVALAFKAGDSSGDGMINFIEFDAMLRQINMPLDQRIGRAIFEKAARDAGDPTLIAVDRIQALAYSTTIRRMKDVMQRFTKKQTRIQDHVTNFLGILAWSGEENRLRAANRFQRKMTVQFCRETWLALKAYMHKMHPGREHVSPADVMEVLKGNAGKGFQAYEKSFLVRVLQKVQTAKRESLYMGDCIAVFLLMSPDSDRCKKVEVLFEVFDTDQDGCLLFHQILAMTRCVCSQRLLIEDSVVQTPKLLLKAKRGQKHLEVSEDDEFVFTQALTSEDGLRIYECVHWYLLRSGRLESNVVTWSELERCLEDQPQVLHALLPGTVRLHRVLLSLPEELPSSPVAVEETALRPVLNRRSSLATLNSALMGFGMSRTPNPSSSALSGSLNASPVAGSQTNTWSSSMGTMLPSQVRSTTPGTLRETTSSGISRPDTAFDFASFDALDADDGNDAGRFRESITEKFQRLLKGYGSLRTVPGTDNGQDDPAAVKEGRPSSSTPRTPGVSRVSSAPTLLTRPGSPSEAGATPPGDATMRLKPLQASRRPGTSPAAGGATGSPLAAVLSPSRLGGRGGSSPEGGAQARVQTAPSRGLAGSPKDKSVPPIPRPFPADAWGRESAERFRLFSAMDHPGVAVRGPAPGEGISYSCHCCHRVHQIKNQA
eukprot:gnl/TRDRNA2_/TRDRNA2_182224_c0_seq1.p1 gnl/TRDRNA2_/TRDRNA2_182224_c0~~gnl/TRDRNA2_/TRDRNA2_182224_c0_seq1.p1  ORF type:complete len:760 (+),score=120.59 gnl/TRDRNA2_/TRDRNA2_182224_c0_seq1:120-2399(+)